MSSWSVSQRGVEPSMSVNRKQRRGPVATAQTLRPAPPAVLRRQVWANCVPPASESAPERAAPSIPSRHRTAHQRACTSSRIVGGVGALHVMRDEGVGSWIERRARVAPDRLALIHGERRCTYGELANRVRRLAHGLRELGVGRGDRVGWLGANHPAFLEVLFASAKLGAVIAPVSHRLNHAVIGDVLLGCSPRVVVVEEAAAGVVLASVVGPRVVVGGGTGADVDYEQLIVRSPEDLLDERIGLDELCMLPHTSGTTGAPKGVMLTHGNMMWNVINLLSVADFRSDDVTIAIAPFFRTGGTGVNVLPVLFKGG